MPYTMKECRYSNYSSPDALGDSDGNETRDEPACSTEEESTMEEGGSGGSNVALGQHSTAGRYGRNKSSWCKFKSINIKETQSL